MNRCELSDLPTDQCACRIHDRRASSGTAGLAVFAPSSIGPEVVAEHPGRCPGCEDRIEPGELIVATEHGWAHQGCA